MKLDKLFSYALVFLVACSGAPQTPEDAAADAQPSGDAGKDAPVDTGKPDVAMDAPTDSPADTMTDSPADSPADADPDVLDAGVDVSVDAPPDVIIIDGGKPDVNPPDSGMDGGVCNMLVNGAQPVPLNQSSGQAPKPQGGNVVTGTYYMTAFTYYNGQSGSLGSAQLTLEVNQSTLESVATQMNMTDRASFTWKTNNTAWAMSQTCPSVTMVSGDYTAAGKTLTLFFDDGNGDIVEEVFTRQ